MPIWVGQEEPCSSCFWMNCLCSEKDSQFLERKLFQDKKSIIPTGVGPDPKTQVQGVRRKGDQPAACLSPGTGLKQRNRVRRPGPGSQETWAPGQVQWNLGKGTKTLTLCWVSAFKLYFKEP